MTSFLHNEQDLYPVAWQVLFVYLGIYLLTSGEALGSIEILGGEALFFFRPSGTAHIT